jgi:predicted acyltransferase
MEIKAVKLEKKNPTDLSVGDYLIIAGVVLLCVGAGWAGFAVLS